VWIRASGVSGPDVTGVITGNFDSNTKLDAVVSTRNSEQLYLLRGQGNGAFQQPVPLLSLSFASITKMITGDFNHDGKLDLASGGYDTPGIILLLGNGDGTFRKPVVSPTGEIAALAAADINRDRILDIIAVDRVNERYGLWLLKNSISRNWSKKLCARMP
jgi:hypothetical protein